MLGEREIGRGCDMMVRLNGMRSSSRLPYLLVACIARGGVGAEQARPGNALPVVIPNDKGPPVRSARQPSDLRLTHFFDLRFRIPTFLCAETMRAHFRDRHRFPVFIQESRVFCEPTQLWLVAMVPTLVMMVPAPERFSRCLGVS